MTKVLGGGKVKKLEGHINSSTSNNIEFVLHSDQTDQWVTLSEVLDAFKESKLKLQT